MPDLSIVIPVLNEAAGVEALLAGLAPWRARGTEVIVVDGGSRDGTPARAAPYCDRVLECAAGRARQMNLGARESRGRLLVFLHADTFLPPAAEGVLHELARAPAPLWGRFDVSLSGTQPLLRLIERMMNLRSRWSGIATGDQAIFVTRDLYARCGGYPDIALMEDIALSARLKRYARPHCLALRVTTSSRRWEQGGIVRTVLVMWWLRLLYFLGVPPARLAARYRHAREVS